MALRTALIWHDEVMGDVVMATPRPITLGATGTATFVVPNLGLPENFAIVRPGNRGFLLTLGDRMRGTISIDGEEKDVAEFVRRGGEGGDGLGGFRATPISDKDWGVIELDDAGTTKLFFNFVPHEEAPVFFTKPVLAAGGAGYVGSAIALMFVFMNTGSGVPLLEAAFRGAGLATIALILAGFGWSVIRQDGDSQSSLAFSVVLHAAILLMTYQLYVPDNPFVWPGPKSLTGNYLVTRLDNDPPPEEEKPKATIGQVKSDSTSNAPKAETVKNTGTKGDEGKSGGKGDVERARDPNAKEDPGPPPKVAFFEDRNKKFLDNIVDRNLSQSLSKFNGIKDDVAKTGAIGFGKGTGTGVGDDLVGTGTKKGSKGKGSGAGGDAKGDFVSGPGKIDTGGERAGGNCVGAGCGGTGPKQVTVGIEAPTGDFSGLSKEEIDRVVRSRQGVFRACYQKELNRQPGLGGKLIINFVIDAGGAVKSARANGGNLKNEGVESCVKSNIMRLKFPAKGGAIVNYPFVFSQGA